MHAIQGDPNRVLQGRFSARCERALERLVGLRVFPCIVELLPSPGLPGHRAAPNQQEHETSQEPAHRLFLRVVTARTGSNTSAASARPSGHWKRSTRSVPSREVMVLFSIRLSSAAKPWPAAADQRM